MGEKDCANRDAFGFKEHLISYHCQTIQDNSQRLSCSENDFTMLYWDNPKCKGSHILKVDVQNGCSDVDFDFFDRQIAYKSYQEIYHCGYALETPAKDEL